MRQPSVKWCNGIGECAGILGVSVRLLKLAKRHPDLQHCFRPNGRCSPDLLRPLLDQYKEELESTVDEGESNEAWKTRKIKAETLLKEIELDEARKKFLEKERVIAFLKQIASAQKSMLKSRLVHELPSKLLGLSVTEMSVLMEKELDSVCQLFQQSLVHWK